MKELTPAMEQLVDQSLVALWIGADCDNDSVASAAQVPWKVIWSYADPVRIASALEVSRNLTYRIIESAAEMPPPGGGSEVRLIYDVSIPADSDRSHIIRKARFAAELENQVAGFPGLLVFAGSPPSSWLELITALAPHACIVVASPADVATPSEVASMVSWWNGTPLALFELLKQRIEEQEERDVLDLQGARGLKPPSVELGRIEGAWELLTRRHTAVPAAVSQGQFDEFLSGDPGWDAVSAGVAYGRGKICSLRPVSGNARAAKHDPVEYVVQKIHDLDRAHADPFDTIEQVQIYAERGSGCSTTLRQIALAVARAGFPTLITRPNPRELVMESVSNFIVRVQDAWAEARGQQGHGVGTRPVCLILDVDAEVPARTSRLLRGLFGDLHRKVVIVRAVRRSDDEIADARGVLQLPSRTSESEILALGRHLRDFCSKHMLQTLPSDNEWRAFYKSFGQVMARPKTRRDVELDTPPLFLIGLYPFVKGRVRDEHSLERYLFGRWREIVDAGGQRLVEILSAAGVYGIAVPFESLARDHFVENALMNNVVDSDKLLLDFFFRWIEFGWQRENWALYIRHPALGQLLTRMLRPEEASAPYSALVPLLQSLSGTEADRLFVEHLAYVLGQRFDSTRSPFSLQLDTPTQKAAREIFNAIPTELHDSSRSICHHHARYYVHLLHACVDAINEPKSTTLHPDVVTELAKGALGEARLLLERARAVADDREKLSNVLNTLAASTAQLAQALAMRGKREEARERFTEAISQANEAIAYDAANGYALRSVITAIHRTFDNRLIDDPAEALDLFELAEDHLESLIRLHDNRQWRNANPIDEEFALAALMQRQEKVAHDIGVLAKYRSAEAVSDVALLVVSVRTIAGHDDLRTAFLDPSRASHLRDVRDKLVQKSATSPRTTLFAYKLFLNDPVGRLDFRARLRLLNELERQSFADYDPYRHDHAALLCQTGAFDAAATIFEEIYATRQANPDQWFWINERLLLDVQDDVARPKPMAVRILDVNAGWAQLRGARSRVKIQMRQFGDLRVNEYRQVFIRFRQTGLQAVDARMAGFDMESMGLQNAAAG